MFQFSKLPIAIAALLLLTACGAPSGGVSIPAADPPVQGLAADQAGLDAEGNPILTSDAPQGEVTEEADAGAISLAPVPAAKPPRRGLAALFGGGRSRGDAPAKSGGFSLFGAANAAQGPGSGNSLPEGTVAPFGAVATACGLSARDLGTAVDTSPKDGRAQWTLHDPIPNSTGPRTHYITGFKDRCARQITGALVLFGDPVVHEAPHYSGSTHSPESAADVAYETVKSRICGVRPGTPCPADRIEKLRKSVSFVSVYPSFGSSGEWFEMLLVNGQLAASGMSAG